ncbi:Putative sodium-coupled neutral amino acid transporter 10, partial [Geodia barretti]
MGLMMFFAFAISLPLSLLRNIDSLSGVAISSLFFYSCLLIRVVLMSLTSLVNTDVWRTVSLVKFDGLLHCLPICALALSCHPQMFVIYIQMADPSIRKMSTVINGSIYMVATGYGLMAFFGYMMFVRDGIKGDVLTNFPHDGLSQLFRFGFSLSVVVGFPLVVFPVRASIYSLLFSKQTSSAEPIPARIFNLITVAIITGTLTIALLVPNVEVVLTLTGATTGSIVSFIFPSLIFLSVVGSHAPFSNRAKFLAVLGVLVMVVGTATIISEHMREDDGRHLPGSKDFPRPFVPQAKGPVAIDDAVLNLPAAVNAPQLPEGDGGDVIKNDVIGDDVMEKEGVHIPAVVVVEEGKMEEGVR